MVEAERQAIIDAVLNAVKTNSRTIRQLRKVLSVVDTDEFELSEGRRVSFKTICDSIVGELDKNYDPQNNLHIDLSGTDLTDDEKAELVRQFLEMVLNRIPEYIDRGQWKAGELYYCSARNPETGRYETSDVWYYGCKYRCCRNLTDTAPAWGNTDWAMIEGNPNFRIEFAEPEQLYDIDNFNATLTIVATLYNQDITEHILADDIQWTRYSEDADGVERVNSDIIWGLSRASSGKVLTLSRDDLGIYGYVPKTVKFTATATLRDGTIAQASFEY